MQLNCSKSEHGYLELILTSLHTPRAIVIFEQKRRARLVVQQSFYLISRLRVIVIEAALNKTHFNLITDTLSNVSGKKTENTLIW